jgi:PAS domain S-box-containing protein
MKKKSLDPGSSETTELRRKAEKNMRGEVAAPASSLSEADVHALVHELQVHQIELQMQYEEIRRAQAETAEALEKYSDLFDFAPIGYFLWDCEGRILEVNLAGAALVGRDRSSVVQKHFGQFLAAEHRTRFSDFCQSILASDVKQTCEVKLLRAGQAVNVLIEGICTQDSQRKEKYCRAAIIDITQQKRAEEEIHSLAEFPEENPNPVLRISIDGLVLYANQPAVKLLETMGWHTGQRLPEPILQRVRHVQGGEPSSFELTCAIGRTFSFAVAASSRAGLTNLYGTEITKRKRAEEALNRLNESLEQSVAERTADLRESMCRVDAEQRRFREVLDALPVYVILLTPDYQISFANRFFENRFGRSEGRRCYQYLFNRNEPCENCETYKALCTNAPHHWEWIGPDGHIYDINDFPFIDVDGERLIMEVGLDITLRRQDERALAQQNAEVRRLADRLRALAVDLSMAEQRERKRLSKILHDHIQQLLVAAQMQIEWLKRDTNLERICSTAQGIESILREVLEATRSLTIELSPPVLHETGLIGGLGWLASRMRDKNQFKINLRLDDSAEPAGEETRLLLFEIARELLFNAMKHAGVTEAHVALLRTGDNRIGLIISDEGRGFDPDLLNRRGVDEVTFGIFSIQQRLAHIGGEMKIEAAPDRGTRISVIVPAEDEMPPEEEKHRTAARAERDGNMRARNETIMHRVLVVDDHKIVREGLVGLMQYEQDIEIVGQAADGPQAIELAERLHPDVIIMDVSLPGMSGVEATRCILAKSPNAKVIGLSMHSDEDLANAMRASGAVAYLTKGGPSKDLIAAIRIACAG